MPPTPQTVEAQSGGSALQLLEERAAATGSPDVDVILKNHDPPGSNAVRFLHRLSEHPSLRSIPTVGEWRRWATGPPREARPLLPGLVGAGLGARRGRWCTSPTIRARPDITHEKYRLDREAPKPHRRPPWETWAPPSPAPERGAPAADPEPWAPTAPPPLRPGLPTSTPGPSLPCLQSCPTRTAARWC